MSGGNDRRGVWSDSGRVVMICPCGFPFESTNAGGAVVPSPGDMTVCLECATVLVLEADHGLRAATPEEIAAVPDDLIERLRQHRDAAAAAKIRRN
jgi:hypothetical protein